MKNYYIWIIDSPALNLCGSEDFRESLMNEKELAPFNFIGDSCFTAFCANRAVLHPEARQTLIGQSLVQANSVLDESKPRGQIVVFHGVFFFCLPFSKVLNTFFFPFFSFSIPPPL